MRSSFLLRLVTLSILFVAGVGISVTSEGLATDDVVPDQDAARVFGGADSHHEKEAYDNCGNVGSCDSTPGEREGTAVGSQQNAAGVSCGCNCTKQAVKKCTST